ncbi:hypothetical protein KQ940_22405 [Marinobacterium sp. D7]|uniref:hypothetical protein n=1 Tax=Marinobacterium ramblicola TaxID=2849041 RepID=UPI001C2D318D|nr:hypothetical protein [Marinobacterium ramblicola]MBV1790823.1 hypothetical protein [Marinobacterium ramblicola]
MKLKLILFSAIIFFLLGVYMYFGSIIFVVDTEGIKKDISSLVCTDMINKWDFGNIDSDHREFHVLMIRSGSPLLCNISIEGYERKEFVALGYFYHTMKMIKIYVNEIDDLNIVKVTSDIYRVDDIKTEPSTYEIISH